MLKKQNFKNSDFILLWQTTYEMKECIDLLVHRSWCIWPSWVLSQEHHKMHVSGHNSVLYYSVTCITTNFKILQSKEIKKLYIYWESE